MWIPYTSSNGPDGQQLNAVNRESELLYFKLRLDSGGLSMLVGFDSQTHLSSLSLDSP